MFLHIHILKDDMNTLCIQRVYFNGKEMQVTTRRGLLKIIKRIYECLLILRC